MRRKLLAITWVFLFILLRSTQCYENDIDLELENLAELYTKWIQKTHTPDMFALPGHHIGAPNYRPPFREHTQQHSDSAKHSIINDLFHFSQCSKDLYYTMTNLKSEWALMMLDSGGKLPSGVLTGNMMWSGRYKECIKIYAPPKDNTSEIGNFHGRYCSSTWGLEFDSFTLPLITVGLCVPSTCNGDQIMSDIKDTMLLIEIVPQLRNLSRTFNLTSVTCKPLEVNFDSPAIGMLVLLSIVGTVVAIGSSITIFEYFVHSKKEDLPHSNTHLVQDSSTEGSVNNIITENDVTDEKSSGAGDKRILLDGHSDDKPHAKGVTEYAKSFFKSFCVFTNGAKILSTDVTEGQLLCVHGIRFLSMAWVILGHTYAFCAIGGVITNIAETIQDIDTWEFQVILQGTFSVDTFFVLSGFLLAFLFMKEADKTDGNISWPLFYIHRYWRLTPVYMILLGFDVALTKYMSSGPFWLEAGFDFACHETWWRNLLYINNFGDPNKQCFGWAWYLANDMQFYIISPIFLYSLWRWPKIGVSIVSVLMLTSWITSGVLTTYFHLIAGYSGILKATNVQDETARMGDYFWKIYVKPYTRIGPYLIGVLLGYFLYKTGKRKRFLNASLQILGWSIGIALPLLVIFPMYDNELNNVASGAYNAVARSAFALGVSWVIFACLTGHADFINKFLSWKMFIPLSRLTYCAYLIHPIIIIGFFYSLQQPLYFTNLTIVTLFFGLLLMSYIAAFVISVMLESPMMAIEKLLLRRS